MNCSSQYGWKLVGTELQKNVERDYRGRSSSWLRWGRGYSYWQWQGLGNYCGMGDWGGVVMEVSWQKDQEATILDPSSPWTSKSPRICQG
jgi:hypothetical protein